MSERPGIFSTGHICATRIPRRAYDVRMKNGHIAVAVIQKKGPHPPEAITEEELLETEIEVEFTPCDMSRCKVRRWMDFPEQ